MAVCCKWNFSWKCVTFNGLRVSGGNSLPDNPVVRAFTWIVGNLSSSPCSEWNSLSSGGAVPLCITNCISIGPQTESLFGIWVFHITQACPRHWIIGYSVVGLSRSCFLTKKIQKGLGFVLMQNKYKFLNLKFLFMKHNSCLLARPNFGYSSWYTLKKPENQKMRSTLPVKIRLF